MDLCVVLIGFGTFHHQLGFEVLPLSPTLSVWTAFDKTFLWYCQSCLSCCSHNRHGPFETRTHMQKHTGTFMQTHGHFGASYAYCTALIIQCAHYSGSCWRWRGFMLSGTVTRDRTFCFSAVIPLIAVNQALQEPLCIPADTRVALFLWFLLGNWSFSWLLCMHMKSFVWTAV